MIGVAASTPNDVDWRNLQRCIEGVRELLTRFAAHPDAYMAPANLPGIAPTGVGMPASLRAFGDAFGLSRFAQAVLILCAGAEMDARIGPQCAACQTDPSCTWPTFGLALRLLPSGHWNELLPASPLRRWRLISLAPGTPLTRAALRIDERVLHFLCGFDVLDERLRGLARKIAQPDDLLSSAGLAADRIATMWAPTLAAPSPPVLNLHGNDRAGKVDAASAVSAKLGLNVIGVSVEALPSGAADQRDLVDLLDREAILTNSTLLFECEDVDGARPELSAAVGRVIDMITAPVLITTARRRPPGARPSLAFAVDRPDRAEQRRLWTSLLGDSMSATAGELAATFDLGADAIRLAAAGARHTVRANGATSPSALAEAVWETCRAEARPALDDLTRRIDARAGWDDLILPAKQKDLIRQLGAQLRHRGKVYDDWGFARAGDRGLAVTALFAGTSGTGKTTAAEILANDLSLDLFQIDLSAVVSKYIGETERNLARIFDRAEGAGAILLFDEADALFGKRTEVKDSHDRNANLEVSYLLQRLEAYRGLAVLTSNLPDALDAAFLRRIRFIVEFPFPDAAARRAIWQRMFPPSVPAVGVDTEKLAQLNASGGQIRNIALNAAFLAASAGEAVQMRHVLAAAKAEFEKARRALTPQEIRGWV